MLGVSLALLGLLGLAQAATCPTGGKTTSFTEKFAKASPYFTFEVGAAADDSTDPVRLAGPIS